MIRNKTRMSTLTTFTQHNIGNPNQGNYAGKRNKSDLNQKGGSKLVTICRKLDFIYRKPQRLHLKIY